MNDYTKFISAKNDLSWANGIDVNWLIDDHLFPHQKALTQWALRKGRAAIFADTGLGKTRMQLAWADAICRAKDVDILILAPLAVAEQTVDEGSTIGIDVTHARDASQCRKGINITNYDRLHLFDTDRFGGIVLDESSIIKHHTAKTLSVLIEAFADTPYKLCATATPAPNDWTELGTHAQFLGVCTRAEMLSEFFVHDGGQTQVWRLKGHARADYWRWVSSWGAMLKSPADIGMDASAYELPRLIVRQITVASDADPMHGELFVKQAQTLTERRQAKRDSMKNRVSACAKRANDSTEPWVIWCELNAEGDALRSAIPDAVEIRGADMIDHKERSLADFAAGRIRVLITKPKIAGFGLNWQHCRNIGFLGVTDSWESYYQAIRRCWRFGQKKQVNAYIFSSEQEGAVKANLERKERDAAAMSAALRAETRKALTDELFGRRRTVNDYNPSKKTIFPEWLYEGNDHETGLCRRRVQFG